MVAGAARLPAKAAAIGARAAIRANMVDVERLFFTENRGRIRGCICSDKGGGVTCACVC